MKQWFQNLGYKLRMWMQGRYGTDEFSRFLTIAGLILLLVSRFSRFSFLYIIGAAAVIWSCLRMYSKNVGKRAAERQKYLNFRRKITSWFSLQKRKWNDRSTHRYLKCTACGTVLRVPKGKGKIKVTCPKCGKETFIKS